MYPESFLQWLGTTAVIFGVLGVCGIIALWVDDFYKRHFDKDDEEGSIRPALAFLSLTTLLVILGCGLYVNEQAGLAQFLWVLASGTAGAGCVLWIEK